MLRDYSLRMFNMAYYECPIKGTGTVKDPYRPDKPSFITRWSAQIPSNSDGTPKFSNCIVWVPDKILMPLILPSNFKKLEEEIARNIIITRDFQTQYDHIESMN